MIFVVGLAVAFIYIFHQDVIQMVRIVRLVKISHVNFFDSATAIPANPNLQDSMHYSIFSSIVCFKNF